jgi:hypothetical protein
LSAGTTALTATPDQAKATAFTEQAAVYALMASANRAAAAAAATVVATQTAAADAIATMSTTSGASASTTSTGGAGTTVPSVDPAVTRNTLVGLATAAAAKQSNREKAAALADQLAANAQRAATFYQSKVDEVSGATAGGGVQ